MIKNNLKATTSNHLPYLIFGLAIFIIYSQTILFEYSLDDHLINEFIPGRTEGLKGIFDIFQQRYSVVDYRPMVIFSYSIEKWITGEMNPSISHFVNLILLFFIAISVYKIVSIYYLTKEFQPIIFITLLFFIVHPINVEVIANLKCRDNLLSCLFVVISINFYLKFFFLEKRIWYLFLGVLLFIIAIFSKLDAVGLLFFIPGILFITKKIKLKSAFIFTIIFYVFFKSIRFDLINSLIPIEEIDTKNAVTFTENPLSQNFTIQNRIAAIALTFWYYIKMLILPFEYRYYYGFDVVKLYSINNWQSIIALSTGIGLLLLNIKYFIKIRFLQICFLGFISFILYALNFITPVAGIIADRYIFISSFFFCGIISYFLFTIIKNKKTYYLICSLIFLSLACLSFYRTTAWENKLTLIERDAPHLIESYEAMRIATATHIEFADKEQNLNKKIDLLNNAIKYAEYGNAVFPKNILLYKLQASAYFKLKKYAEAKNTFRIAIRNDSSDLESYNFLGDIYYIERNLDSSFYFYNMAFSINKNDPTLITNISTILYEKGNKTESFEFNQNLILQNDSLYTAWENLGYYYLLENDTLKAINYFKNSFKYGLRNPEMGQVIVNYLRKNKSSEEAEYFLKYTQ